MKTLSAAFQDARVAAIHVDLQGFYLAGPDAHRGYAVANDLARSFRRAGVENYWVAITHRNAILRVHEFQRDNHRELAGIARLIDALPHETLFEKNRDSLFGTWNLKPEILLKSQRKDTLVITGVMHHACVFATATAAVERGFKVFVVADATDRPEKQFDSYESFMHGWLAKELRKNLSVVYADDVVEALPKLLRPSSLRSRKEISCIKMQEV